MPCEKPLDFFVVFLVGLFAKMVGQNEDVIASLVEWIEVDGDDLESKIQVAAKPALFNFFFQVFVRRGQHADVDFNGLVVPDTGDFPLFQHAQQFDLSRDRHVTDFVQEQGAPVRVFEFSLAVRDRVGEGSLDVTKQFAFHQVFCHGAGIDCDERFFLAGAVLMNRLRYHIFAGSRFTRDQDPGVRRCDPPEPVHDALHAVAGVNQVVEPEFFIQAVLQL